MVCYGYLKEKYRNPERNETSKLTNYNDIIWLCINSLQWKIHTKW